MLRRVLAGIVLLVAAGVAAVLWMPAVGEVSADALSFSVTREADSSSSLDVNECRRERGRVWECLVLDPHTSGSVAYRVELHGRRCWSARRVSPFAHGSGELPRRMEACVELRDQLRLSERL